MKFNHDNVRNIQDFVDQNENTKSEIQKCIKYLVRETNKQKLNYGQLRYIFRVVRERCGIEIPKEKNNLYELPDTKSLDLFFNNIENSTHRLIFKTLENTGLRISELCKLEVKHINFSENTIFIKNGKGKKDRVVPFDNRLKEKLTIYLESRKNKYLFESNRNTKYSTRRIEQLCNKYSKNILFKITPHTFRHLYFSFLASKSISKEHRMLLAGHSRPETQDIYTHLSLDGIKDDVIRLFDNK